MTINLDDSSLISYEGKGYLSCELAYDKEGGLAALEAQQQGLVQERQDKTAILKAAEAAEKDHEQKLKILDAKVTESEGIVKSITRQYSTDVLVDPAGNHKRLAGRRATLNEELSLLRDAVAYGRRVVRNVLQLHTLEAARDLKRVIYRDLTAQALISLTHRAIASHELLQLEGTVVFPQVGRSNDLHLEALQALRNYHEARQAVEDLIEYHKKHKVGEYADIA